MPQILLNFTHAAHNKLTLVPVTARRKALIIWGVQGMDPAIQKQGSRRVFHLVSDEWNIDEWCNYFLFFVHSFIGVLYSYMAVYYIVKNHFYRHTGA